jgi:hypothetical protein
MQLVELPRFRPGDTVRYVGQAREPALGILPGTLGSIVAGPLPRRASPMAPERYVCQVLFGYRTAWVPVERLESEIDRYEN